MQGNAFCKQVLQSYARTKKHVTTRRKEQLQLAHILFIYFKCFAAHGRGRPVVQYIVQNTRPGLSYLHGPFLTFTN